MQEEKWKVKKDGWGEVGRLKAGRKSDGWIFGCFREIQSLAKTEDFEFKYWAFKKDKGKKNKKHHEPKFQVLAKEYNFIIEGKIEGKVYDGKTTKEVTLEAGDYIIIKPGVIINLQERVLEDTKGITIKTPSRYGDTIKKSFIEKLLNF